MAEITITLKAGPSYDSAWVTIKGEDTTDARDALGAVCPSAARAAGDGNLALAIALASQELANPSPLEPCVECGGSR